MIDRKQRTNVYPILAFTKHARIAEPTSAINSDRRLRQRPRTPHADGFGTRLFEDCQLHARYQDPAATGLATSSVLALSLSSNINDSIKTLFFLFSPDHS